MTSNQQYLEKASLTSAQLQSQGGYLSPAQANEFIRQIFDATVLAQELRRVVMLAPRQELNKLFVGARIARGVSPENADQSVYARTPSFQKIVLDAVKYSLFYEISEDAIEDNIAGDGIERTVAEHFATQFGIDLEDASINGDTVSPTPTNLSAPINATVTTIPVTATSTFPTTSTAGYLLIDSELISYGAINPTNFLNAIRGDGPAGFPTVAASHLIGAAVTWSPHPLIGFNDGYIKQAITGGANLYDASVVNSGNITKTQYFEMFKQMPNQYKRGAAKNQLRWIESLSQYINWQEYLADKNANTGYDVLAGTEFYPIGMPVIAAHAWPDTEIMLTYPKNLIFGVWRQMRIRKAALDKESIATDQRFYTATIRGDFKIERPDAIVLGTGFSGSV